MAKKALYSGSFDPITNGHLNIIIRASKLFDELIVLVADNPEKNCLFDLEKRIFMLNKVCNDIPNVTVDYHMGLIADYVMKNNVDIVVRGLRNAKDFTYELEMAQYNAELFANNAETVFLMTAPQNSFISSTGVKEIINLNGDISGLVPEEVKNIMEELK